MEIVMDNSQVQVVTSPQNPNLKLLVAIDVKSGLRVTLPFTLDEAKKIGVMLSSGIAIAIGPVNVKGNGQ